MNKLMAGIKRFTKTDKLVSTSHRHMEKDVTRTSKVINDASKVIGNGVTIKISKAVRHV